MYCQLKNDYLNMEHYKSYCCGLIVPDYLKCPIYDSIESENTFVGDSLYVDIPTQIQNDDQA